jgi:hypothetical protein
MPCSFKFLRNDLQQQLLRLFRASGIKHVIDQNAIVHYSSEDEDVVENHLIKSIRDKIYPSWQVLSVPQDWATRYRNYMKSHQISFEEELVNGDGCFLIHQRLRTNGNCRQAVQRELAASCAEKFAQGIATKRRFSPRNLSRRNSSVTIKSQSTIDCLPSIQTALGIM